MSEPRLTERQDKFVKTFAASGDKQLAARDAGYAQPRSTGYRVAESPSVYAEIVKEQQRILMCELLPAAVACLGEIIRNPLAPTGARVNAAKLVFDRTLGTEGGGMKEPHEMTADELAKAISELEKAAANQAKEISGEVIEDEAPDPFA